MKGKSGLILCLLAIFFGYIGLDKLYFNGLKSSSLKWMLIRLVSFILFVIPGLIWVIIDIFQVIAHKKYKLDPRDY